MGKRNRVKHSKQQKVSESSSNASDTTDISELHHTNLLEPYHTKYESSLMLQDLQESISGIYKEYLKDLKLRKQKRLKLKTPTSESQHYNLVINGNYRNQLKLKVHELLIKNYRCGLNNIVDETMEYFVNKLEIFIEEADDKSRLLQIVYLNEAYHSLRNSVSQISKILIELYTKEELYKISMKKFYENILIRQKKLLAFAKTQDNSHFAIEFIEKIYDQYEIFMKSGIYSPESMLFDDTSDLEEYADEPVHSLPLEELINYINGPSLSSKMQKKISINKCVKNEMDEEVLDFENRLANATPLISKPIPYCSFEFLQSLNDRYHQVRRILLSN